MMQLQVLSIMLLPFRVGFSAMARCNTTVVKYSSKANAIGSPMRLLHERVQGTRAGHLSLVQPSDSILGDGCQICRYWSV